MTTTETTGRLLQRISVLARQHLPHGRRTYIIIEMVQSKATVHVIESANIEHIHLTEEQK